jgi:hypothetical protein
MGEMATKAFFNAVINKKPVKSCEIPWSIRDHGTQAKIG